MKTVIRVLVVVALVFSSANAQNFQGVATYKTQRAFDIKMDSTQIGSDMQKQMQAMLKKQFQKTFTLSFSKEASVYKEDETLAPPQVGGSGMQVQVMGLGGGTDVLYKNTKNNTFANQRDTMGKIFLVKDSIKPIEWQLEKDTKYIGQYQCFKATFIKMVPKPVDFKSMSDINEDEDEKETKPEMIERIVEAWYTPQIPVNNGPKMYQGLPGLILEIHDGKLNIVCSNIVMNPKEKVEIEAPTKGKKVNQAEYDKIREKKRKEMMERFAPRKGNRDGERIEIRIGG